MCMPQDPVCNLLFIEFSCHAVSVLESCRIVLHVHELVSYHIWRRSWDPVAMAKHGSIGEFQQEVEEWSAYA